MPGKNASVSKPKAADKKNGPAAKNPELPASPFQLESESGKAASRQWHGPGSGFSGSDRAGAARNPSSSTPAHQPANPNHKFNHIRIQPPARARKSGSDYAEEASEGSQDLESESSDFHTMSFAGDPSLSVRPSPQYDSPLVAQALSSPGVGLESVPHRLAAIRLGLDPIQVRLHTGIAAARSAQALGAQAYTVGNDIVFGEGRYSPHTSLGQALLAHELTHVAQQSEDGDSHRLRAKTDGKKGSKTIRFKIKVSEDLTADELTREFVKQYYGYTTDDQIQSKLSLWTNNSQRGTTPKEVKQGFVWANVTTENETDFDDLDPKEKEAVNAETDQQFWKSTGYKPGQKLGNSPKDKEMAEIWKGLRRSVLTEDKQRKEIDALPEDIKKILFAGGAGTTTASPADYTQILRIANKLAGLSPAGIQDYLSRINASTASLDDMESSVDAFIQFQAAREKQSQENEKAAKPLLGAETLYTLYRSYKDTKSNLALAKALKGAAKDKAQAAESVDILEESAKKAEAAFLAELKLKGFDSIEAFEASIEAFRLTFRTQAVNLALDVLARYDHMLYEERKKLQQPGAGAALAKGIADSKASTLYQGSKDKSAEAGRMLHPGMTPQMLEKATSLNKESQTLHAQADAEVIRGSGNDPLVAERGTDLEKLAGLDAAGTQDYLQKTLEKRAEDVRTARQEFKEDPDRVFKLPDLVSASQKIQGIDDTTIYSWIIRDYIAEQKSKHLLSQIAIGILALALTLLVPGGGWLAAAALVANAGISTYQAYAAYKEYEEQEKDYNLHFLSEEPSLFWVGLAVAAAALDLGMATSALVKESAAGLKALKGPMLDFSKDNDLAKLVSKIEAADGLKAEVKTALEREAKASLAANAAWKEAAGHVSLGMNGGDIGGVTQTFRALYYSVKRGINTIAKLRADAKLLEAMGDITKMTGAERAELEAAFEEVKQLVKAGQAKSMDEASLLGFIDRSAINRGTPGFQAKLLDEMKAWKPLTAEQQQALNALKAQKAAVSTLYDQKAAAIEELNALRAQTTKSADDLKEIRSLEAELSGLDPHWDPKAKPTMGKGKIAEAEASLLVKEKDAAKAELTLYDRLRAAAPSDAAKEKALKGVSVDQIGTLKTKPTALQADHIVSVREIADMDGFSKLSWKDQKAVVDMKENLIAMDGSANASKGDRTWRSWNQASNYYEPTAIDAMAKREAQVRDLIKAEIQNRLAKTPGASP